jgi:hypothetical protein
LEGFGLDVLGELPAPAEVRVTWEGGEHSFTCAPGAPCRTFVEAGAPPTISVEVTWDGGRLTTTAAPQYEPFYPNGPRCPGMCLTAGVQVGPVS